MLDNQDIKKKGNNNDIEVVLVEERYGLNGT